MKVLRVAPVLAFVLWSGPALSSDCPDFGLTGPDQQTYCDEFKDLLYAPFAPNSDRNSSLEEQQKMDALIADDPLWGEVYRTDPKRTLELIARIRDAGGLDRN